MPVTSIDVSESVLNYVNDLQKRGKIKSFKAFVEELIEFHKYFTMSEWTENLFYFHGLRYGHISQRSIRLLVDNLDEEDKIKAGRMMGTTFKDLYFAVYGSSLAIQNKEEWNIALNLLERQGWGSFEIKGDVIAVRRPFLPLELLHGYLEEAFNVELEKVSTTENIGIFRIVKSNFI